MADCSLYVNMKTVLLNTAKKLKSCLKSREKLEKQYPDMIQMLDEHKRINADINDIIAYEQFLKGYRFGVNMIIAAIKV